MEIIRGKGVFKWLLLFVLSAAALSIAFKALWYFSSDREEVESHITSSNEVVSAIGNVLEIKNTRVVSVFPGVTVEGETIGGYKRYDFHVEGERGSAKVTVKKKDESERYEISVRPDYK